HWDITPPGTKSYPGETGFCRDDSVFDGLPFELNGGIELHHSRHYIIFNFGKSCESTRPTGSCFAFTTIKSSMFRSSKVFSASAASAFSQMQIGLGVITFFNGCESKLSPLAMC